MPNGILRTLRTCVRDARVPVAKGLATTGIVAILLLTSPAPVRAQDDVNPTPPESASPATVQYPRGQEATIYAPPRPPQPLVTVPEVVGLSRAEATSRLELYGLHARPGDTLDSPQPRGIVLETSPRAGEHVKRGSVVSLRLASGMNRVPHVLGDTLQRADSQLNAEGFRIGDRSERYHDSRPGLVVAQAPPAGSLAAVGTPVALVVSMHPQVPKLAGLPEQAAIERLRSVTLLGQRSGAEPSRQPRGTVLRSDPEADASVVPGSRVRYWLASGENLVPDVLQQPREQALRMIQSAGFAAGEIGERADLGAPGRVVVQAPAARTRAPLGSPVSLTLSKVLQMPDIVGMPESEATAALGDIGLLASRSAELPSPQPLGIVLDSDPASGARIAADTRVSYRTASGRNRVPDLGGETSESARQLIVDAGFRPDDFTGQPVQDGIGLVLRQTPTAGTLAPLDSTIAAIVGIEFPLVPDVTRQLEANAIARLGSAGFQARRGGVESSPHPQGTVLRTQPAAGTEAAPDTQVAYWLASGSNIVPELIGESQAGARQQATVAGFRLDEPGYRYAPDELDRVLEQTPPAGTVAPLGTGIAPVLGTNQSNVPLLKGKSYEDARSTLAQFGLRAGVPEWKLSLAKADTVVSQNPGAGSPARQGDTVSLQLARPWLGLAVGSTLVLALGGAAWWTQIRPWPLKLPVDVDSSLIIEPPPVPDSLDSARDADVSLQAHIEPGALPDPTIPVIDKEVRDEQRHPAE